MLLSNKRFVTVCSTGTAPKLDKIKIDEYHYLSILDTEADILLIPQSGLLWLQHKIKPCHLTLIENVTVSNQMTNRFATVPHCPFRFYDYRKITFFAKEIRISQRGSCLDTKIIKQSRQFLGLANYFCKCILDFTNRTACTDKLAKAKEQFLCAEEYEQLNSILIISKLVSRPLLSIFAPTLHWCQLNRLWRLLQKCNVQ